MLSKISLDSALFSFSVNCEGESTSSAVLAGTAPMGLIVSFRISINVLTSINLLVKSIFLSLIALWPVVQHNLYDERVGKMTTRVSLCHNIVP